ncbi:MAG: MBL fold metallo-hydrolase [Pyrinomonadaceae bacterium]
MKLIVLGSGTSVPHPHRSSSGFWIECADGSVLLDCSSSALHRMAQEGLDWVNLDSIWISHFHLDHCGGLAPFLFATKHAPQTQSRTKPLRIYGAPGLRDLIQTFSNAYDYGLLDQPFPVEIIEIEPLAEFQILGNVEAVAHSTFHTPDSHALHIRETDKTLVYTADTGFDETLTTFARRVDLLLMECSFLRNKPIEKHLELPEAIHLIRRADPKRAVLTHFYAEWDKVDFATEVASHKSRVEIIEAIDGLRISV